MTAAPKCRQCRRPLKTERERDEGVCVVCRALPKPVKPGDDGGGSAQALLTRLIGRPGSNRASILARQRSRIVSAGIGRGRGCIVPVLCR